MTNQIELNDFRLGQIGQIAVTVTDVDRAVEFYRDVLGLPLLFQAPPGLAFFDCGGIRLMLSSSTVPPLPGDAFVIYYRVDDIDAAFQTLSARGATFFSNPHLIAKMPDHELWMAFLRDPDGNPIGLMHEKR